MNKKIYINDIIIGFLLLEKVKKFQNNFKLIYQKYQRFIMIFMNFAVYSTVSWIRKNGKWMDYRNKNEAEEKEIIEDIDSTPYL